MDHRNNIPGNKHNRTKTAGRYGQRVASLYNRYRRLHHRGSTAGRTWKLLLAATLILPLLAVFTLGVAAAAAYDLYIKDLPSLEKLEKRQVFKTTKIYDRNGQLLYELWDPQAGRRTVVPLSEMPQTIIDATIATEDAHFYENPGVDPLAILRAAWQNYTGRQVVSGASTITMQLVRNVFFTSEERYQQTLSRKIKEAILAYQLSQRYSKDHILEMYLNEIYYGNLSYGIEAAAWSYFGKHARDLTLGEVSMLAGLPQAPSEYNPLLNYKAAKQRQAEVLERMVKQGYITAEQAEKAKNERLTFARQGFDLRAPHFMMYVRNLLERRFGPEKLYYGGLQVQTSIDSNLLAIAEKAAREHIAKIKNRNANNAALVAIDPKTGEILVMLGSVDYYDPSIDGQVNMAIAERQPGSTLKPFTYVTAFERGLTAATVIMDQPIEFPGDSRQRIYRPHNHDWKWHGPVTVRRALAASLNIPALLTLKYIGIPALLDTAHKMGITSLTDPNRYGLSVTLGGGEVKLTDLTFAYAPFANNGRQVGAAVPLPERQPGMREYEPVAILKVTDADGKVLYEYKPGEGKQLITPQQAFLINSILSDDEARQGTYGRHSFLSLSRPAAAKTGTTDDYRDGWTIGYTPDLVAGVWVGNANNEPMKDVYGVAGAGYIWHNFMEDALTYLNKPPTPFPKPEGLVQAQSCALGRTDTAWNSPMVTEWFIKGTEPHKGLDGSPGGWILDVTTTRRDDGLPEVQTVQRPILTCASWPGVWPAAPTPESRTPPSPTAVTEPAPAKVVVPSVVGLPEAEARRRIEAARLKNTYANYQGHDALPESVLQKVPIGHVLSQTPEGGTIVAPSTTVYLAVRKD
ncbi:MAG: PBP1A family penicillin-binding protein [Chloroflexi bacterium]|nr:PBP1A family penicillin-binding protein [Chloroflexota bacterium]